MNRYKTLTEVPVKMDMGGIGRDYDTTIFPDTIVEVEYGKVYVLDKYGKRNLTMMRSDYVEGFMIENNQIEEIK